MGGGTSLNQGELRLSWSPRRKAAEAPGLLAGIAAGGLGLGLGLGGCYKKVFWIHY